MLHIRCSHDILVTLAHAGIPGERMCWADPLCQGPTPNGLSNSRWRRKRTAFLAARYGITLYEAEMFLDQQDQKLEQWTHHTEIILWFEQDLFDQIILIYLLDWFARRSVKIGQISLVCIGDHPEIRHFTGLNQLDVDQLALLFAQRQPVNEAMFDLAHRAWAAFTAASPLDLISLMEREMSALPFLHSALRRHMQDYPNVQDGLSLTEHRVLEGIADGIPTPLTLFQHIERCEYMPWLKEGMFWPILDDLASNPTPLITISGCKGKSLTCMIATDFDPGAVLSNTHLTITELGLAVLAREENRLDWHNIDRWLGGVHLCPDCERWGWDEGVENLALLF